MTAHPHFRRAYPISRAALLAACLLGTSGCAQITFPELPPGLFAKQSTDAGDEASDATPSRAGEVAETIDPAQADGAEPTTEPTSPGKLFEWDGDAGQLTRIVIDTDTQTAHFYKGDQRVGWTTIASGVASHPTPSGQFAILEKVRDKRSNLYGKIVDGRGRVIRASADGNDRVPRGGRFVGASMPNFMRLTYDGIGMHAGPIPKPGQPASHGCIRMPPQVASAVFERVAPGTAVTVIGSGPDYGNYAERIARQRAEEQARRAAAAAAQEGTALDALDAEIEALDEAGVGVGAAAAGSSIDAEPAAGASDDDSANAAETEAEPRSKTRRSSSGTADGGADASATRADAGAVAQQPGTSQKQSTAPEAEPTATPDGGAPAQPTDQPTARPREPSEQRYYPPAPPPSIRSAGPDAAGAGDV